MRIEQLISHFKQQLVFQSYLASWQLNTASGSAAVQAVNPDSIAQMRLVEKIIQLLQSESIDPAELREIIAVYQGQFLVQKEKFEMFPELGELIHSLDIEELPLEALELDNEVRETESPFEFVLERQNAVDSTLAEFSNLFFNSISLSDKESSLSTESAQLHSSPAFTQDRLFKKAHPVVRKLADTDELDDDEQEDGFFKPKRTY